MFDLRLKANNSKNTMNTNLNDKLNNYNNINDESKEFN